MRDGRGTGAMAAARGERGWRGTRVVGALMLREMATTYGRSPGGYVWAIAEPVLGIVLLTAVFSAIIRTPPLGSNFALFYATGMLPFLLYNDIAGKVGNAIRYSRPLLAYPSVTYIDAIVSRVVLNTMTGIVVLVIVMGSIITFYNLSVSLDYGAILHAIVMAVALGLGVGTVNCYLSGLFPVWERVWAIVTRPLFIISGIFFLVDGLPEPLRTLILWNPVAHVIIEMRAGFFATYDGRYASPLFVYGVSTILLFFGLLLLYRAHREILDEGA